MSDKPTFLIKQAINAAYRIRQHSGRQFLLFARPKGDDGLRFISCISSDNQKAQDLVDFEPENLVGIYSGPVTERQIVEDVQAMGLVPVYDKVAA